MLLIYVYLYILNNVIKYYEDKPINEKRFQWDSNNTKD